MRHHARLKDIPISERFLYRKVSYNMGHGGHYLEPGGSLPQPAHNNSDNPWMILKSVYPIDRDYWGRARV